MKKALISPQEGPIKYISGWTQQKPYKAIYSDYPDSCRVAQVEDQDFPVAPPLFWIDCADDVTTYGFYYDTASQTLKPIVDVPPPVDPGV